MAGDKVNNYSQVDSNILELQLTTDKTFKGYHQLTLTNYDNTTVPAIAAGSAIECNGALYKFDTEEAISTTDPVTSAAVADGTVYVVIVPGETTCTAAFTATAPTWSDSKQGWYGTGGQANYRYAEFAMNKATAAYSYKNDYLKNKFRKKAFVIANRATPQSNTGTLAKIDINNEIIDLWGNFDSATNYRFTAPRSGFYDVSLYAVTNTYNVYLYLYLNGAAILTNNGENVTVGGGSQNHLLSCPGLYLAANDYIEFYADVNSGSGVITPYLNIIEK